MDLTAVPNSVFGLISAVIVVLILKLLGASMLKIVIVAIFTCALVAGWMDVVKMFKINKADSSRYGGTVRFEEVIGSVIATIVYFFILFVWSSSLIWNLYDKVLVLLISIYGV